MSWSADYLNALPYDEKQKVLKLMKEGTLVLCDNLDEVLSAIRGFNPPEQGPRVSYNSEG